MPSSSLIEIHRDGQWVPAAELQAFDDERCRFEYLAEYVFGDRPLPVALGMPVGFQEDAALHDGHPDRRAPAFLYDLVPQGRGRCFLLRLLRINDNDRLVMPLVMRGALNPIGCLRLRTAVGFYESHPERWEGFGLADIEREPDAFLLHLAQQAMLSSGTTGVQGVAPKHLLAEDRDGRWFPDLALPDERAHRHWLVKLPRGGSPADLMVYRNEAAYLRLARACGVRVHHDPMFVGHMMFVRRFDRQVSGGRVERLHQESLASLAGLRGFGAPATQNELLSALRAHRRVPTSRRALPGAAQHRQPSA